MREKVLLLLQTKLRTLEKRSKVNNAIQKPLLMFGTDHKNSTDLNQAHGLMEETLQTSQSASSKAIEATASLFQLQSNIQKTSSDLDHVNRSGNTLRVTQQK